MIQSKNSSGEILPQALTPKVGGRRLPGLRGPLRIYSALLAICVICTGAFASPNSPSHHSSTPAVNHASASPGAAKRNASPRSAAVIQGTPRQQTGTPYPFPTGARWQNIGPYGYGMSIQRIYYGNQAIIGRVNDAVFDPRNTSVYYVATAGGGVWKTSDSGVNWSAMTDGEETLFTSCIAMDPTNSNTLYVGTGDFTGRYPQGIPAQGVLKTTNGGTSWTSIGAAQFGRFQVSRILVDPENPQIVTVSTGRGLGLFGQVWRSTDGGTNWNAVIPTQAVWCDVAMSARMTDGNRVYYAAGFLRDGKRQIWRSVNRGASWVTAWSSAAIQNMGRSDNSSLIAVGASRTNPMVVYAVVGRPGDATVMRSDDQGDNWTDITASFPSRADNFKQTWYNVSITLSSAMDAQGNNSDVVYVGGLDMVQGDANGNWRAAGQTLTNQALIHSDQQHAVVNPNNTNQLLVCTDGGVYLQTFDPTNRTFQYTSLNTNLFVTQFHHAQFHPLNPQIILGGAQDNGTTFLGGDTTLRSWKGVQSGDGGYAVLNTMNGAVQLATIQNLDEFRVTGSSFENSTRVFPRLGTDRVKFIAPVTFDPAQPNLVYFGTNFLNSYDTSTGAFNQRMGNQSLSQSGMLSAITVSAANPNWIYTGSTTGEVWLSSNKGANWTQIDTATSPNISLPEREITSILVGPNTPDAVYVGVGGTGTGHLWLCYPTTAADTLTWRDISGSGATGLPNVALNSIALDPRDNSGRTIYVGTDTGMYYSLDGGTTWTEGSRSLGMPRVRVTYMQAIAGTGYLMAATFGRGFWRIPLVTNVAPRSIQPPASTSRQAGLAPPVDLQVVGGSGEVDLFWPASTGAASYNIKRATTPGGPYTTIQNVTGASYQDQGLLNDIFYYYVVSAVSAGTESSDSSQASAQPTQYPSPPQNLEAAPGDKIVALSWDPAPGASFYKVSRTTETQADDLDQIASDIIETAYVDKNVTNGQTYFYSVTAVDDKGNTSQPADEIVSATPGGASDSVSGTVTFLNNGTPTPLPGIMVEIHLASGNGDAGSTRTAGKAITRQEEADSGATSTFTNETMTDAEGRYAFNNLADGAYMIEVTPPPGQPDVPALTRTLDMHVNNGASTEASFVLSPPGTFQQGLSMVSIPYQYGANAADAASLFGVSLRNNITPIVTYDPVTNNYLLYPRLPGITGADIQPGRGYWIVENGAKTFTNPGSPVESPFQFTLSPGWNMIGNPFTTPVNVADLTFQVGFALGDIRANDPISQMDAVMTNLIGSTIWGYDTQKGQYASATTLQPFQGYWIYISPTTAKNEPVEVTFRNDMAG